MFSKNFKKTKSKEWAESSPWRIDLKSPIKDAVILHQLLSKRVDTAMSHQLTYICPKLSTLNWKGIREIFASMETNSKSMIHVSVRFICSDFSSLSWDHVSLLTFIFPESTFTGCSRITTSLLLIWFSISATWYRQYTYLLLSSCSSTHERNLHLHLLSTISHLVALWLILKLMSFGADGKVSSETSMISIVE